MTGTMPNASLYFAYVYVHLWIFGYGNGFVFVYLTWVLWLCVCTDPIRFYTSLWLKCVGIFQRIVNSISVSKSTVGIHVLESLYTTTTFRLDL